ncbi:eukaryotic rRNA processing [Gautieria morchelliformis]|nr:eukaryotic rRNA processing [Gautieria morchelliformis]
MAPLIDPEDIGDETDDEVAEEEGEEAFELDEVSSVDDDAVPRQKITIDNKEALERIRDSIKLDPSLPWTETLTTTYPLVHDVDVSDDLDRELSFYKQALHSAEAARTLAASHDLPFTRPSDYFAEMVKSDAHMERIRQRLLDESAGIKKGEEKRRQREGKKFGKQVQVEKVREREKSKKDLDDKIKSLKRKRKGGALDDTQGEEFEVALEDAIADRPAKRPRMPRTKRDEKYGRGGRGSVGWRSKQNTRESTDQFESGGRGRGRGSRGGRGGRGSRGTSRGTKRLGKSRRLAGRSK